MFSNLATTISHEREEVDTMSLSALVECFEIYFPKENNPKIGHG